MSTTFPSHVQTQVLTAGSRPVAVAAAGGATAGRGRVGRALRGVKRGLLAAMRRAIVDAPLPLGAQQWATRHLLPVGLWDKSLAYQQCLADRVVRRHGLAVQGGPFRGVVCLDDADEGCLVPKLLGCYEEELSPALERFIAEGCDRVIDVGCASGYYVVGLAAKMPRAEAFGFDIDREAIARCRELAALNHLTARVTLRGLCTHADLQELIRGRTLLIMDCEGAEYDLLGPQAVPALRRCDMIIECHDFVNPAISGTLAQRFRESHVIERIATATRTPDPVRYPGLRALPPRHWPAAVDERRLHAMEWLVMRVR